MTGAHPGTFEGLEVGKISGHFVIPRYQRGYRWTALEVTRLLQDILDSEGSTYYLQPIVVKAVRCRDRPVLPGAVADSCRLTAAHPA